MCWAEWLARMVSRRTSSNVVSCVTLMLTINFTSLGVPLRGNQELLNRYVAFRPLRKPIRVWSLGIGNLICVNK